MDFGKVFSVVGKLVGGATGGVTSFFAGAQYWLIAIVVASVASGAFGYYKGADHVTTKVINAADSQIAAAQAAATKAQAAQDAKDYASTKADYERRLAGSAAREAAYKAALAKLHSLVPRQPECKVSAEAIKALNDPSIVGGVQ